VLAKLWTSDSTTAPAAAQDAAKSVLEASTPAERCAQVRLVPLKLRLPCMAGHRTPRMAVYTEPSVAARIPDKGAALMLCS
jgi:hypothetical protein